MKMNGCLLVSVFTAVLGMFQFGYHSTVVNSPAKEVEKFIKASLDHRYGLDLTEKEVSTYFSIIVSVFLAGGMLGSLSAGYVGNRLGRKRGLLLAQTLSLPAALLMGICRICSSYEMLFVGRLLVGLACGLFTGLSPMYVAEIAPVRVRGAMGTVNQLAVTLGLLIALGLGSSSVLGTENLWPLAFAMHAVPATIQTILLPMLPESPRYLLVTKKDFVAGEKALKRLRGTTECKGEMDEIVSEASSGDAGENRSMSALSVLLSPEVRLPLVVCIWLQLSQQWSGIGAIFYYSTSFFRSSGIPCEASEYASMSVGAVMVSMTLVSIPLMERLGRRALHLVGMAGIVVFSIIITVGLQTAEGEGGEDDGNGECNDENSEMTASGVVTIVSTLCFVVSFAMGPGSIPWMAIGELFTQKSRGGAASICVFVNWLSNLAVGLSFPAINSSLKGYSFLPFMIVTFVLLILLFFYFPETKNKTSEEIALVFRSSTLFSSPAGIGNKMSGLTPPPSVTQGTGPGYGAVQ